MGIRYSKRRLLVPAVLAVSFALGAAATTAAGTISAISLSQDGHNETNTISQTIFDGTGVTSLSVGTVSASYRRDTKIIRGLGNIFTKGPSFDLDKKLDLAAVLAESLRDEAKAMGLPLATEDAAAASWKVSGELKDIYIECWQMTGMGSIVFYGFIDVALQVQGPDGVTEDRRYRVHNFSEGHSGAFSRTGASKAALASLIVTGSQEILGRLNREFLKAKSSADIDKKVAALKAPGIAMQQADLHLVGLSGAAGADAALLGLLPAEPSSDGRVLIIDALARLGAPAAVPVLVQRYEKEDEQGRWYTLKAMDYIGGDAAAALIAGKGPQDEEYSVKALAARIQGIPLKK
jgi:hypothetical protein